MAARKTKGTVGVIGLGIMGGAFAKNLVEAGWRVIGYDISAAKRREAKRAGVELANDAVAVAAAAPIILTSLPKPQALADTVRKIAAAKLKGKVVAEMSTFTISDKEKAERVLRKAGHIMIDCPVSGTGSQAKSRDLVFYASGDTKAIARLRPVLMGFGRNVFNVGQFGNGSRMKYVANLLVAINNVASAEAMVLGMKAGLDPRMIVDLVTRWRRQLARLRIACADDGERALRRRHHEDIGVGQGYAGDRRLCAQDPRTDTGLQFHQRHLREGHEKRPRRPRHGRGLRST